jgi:two-component system response regulator NreC
MISPAPPTTVLDTITIVLADDHRMVRTALRLLLETQDDFEVVADVGDASSALQRVLEHGPTILVLDLNMPGELSGLDAIPRIHDLSPDTAVVVLTMQSDPGFARRTLHDGARAYVLKESADEELVGAVRRAAAGEVYVAARLREACAAVLQIGACA